MKIMFQSSKNDIITRFLRQRVIYDVMFLVHGHPENRNKNLINTNVYDTSFTIYLCTMSITLGKPSETEDEARG